MTSVQDAAEQPVYGSSRWSETLLFSINIPESCTNWLASVLFEVPAVMLAIFPCLCFCLIFVTCSSLDPRSFRLEARAKPLSTLVFRSLLTHLRTMAHSSLGLVCAMAVAVLCSARRNNYGWGGGLDAFDGPKQPQPHGGNQGIPGGFPADMGFGRPKPPQPDGGNAGGFPPNMFPGPKPPQPDGGNAGGFSPNMFPGPKPPQPDGGKPGKQGNAAGFGLNMNAGGNAGGFGFPNTQGDAGAGGMFAGGGFDMGAMQDCVVLQCLSGSG